MHAPIYEEPIIRQVIIKLWDLEVEIEKNALHGNSKRFELSYEMTTSHSCYLMAGLKNCDINLYTHRHIEISNT